MDQILYTFEHVRVDGPQGLLLTDVDGEIPGAGVTVVAGPSGSGKSTLLRLCNRLERPSSGRIWFRGVEIDELDPMALRRRVGMVFQRPTPFGGTVIENLRVADPEIDEPAAGALLTRVGLDATFIGRAAHELSGGEAQRLCLARTLATDPEVLLMDEPTSSVDSRSRAVLEDLARELAVGGVAVVWVTHDMRQLRRLADNVVVMVGGRIAHTGPPESVERDASAAVRAFVAESEGGDE
ncbi:MAG TPA: phosphate ABC transporter ATP-binding protein [Acidimicrobiia bacterium]|nr:phosphate ABC transporter ATP-binding protein [Acidimicrobiia bacterium]